MSDAFNSGDLNRRAFLKNLAGIGMGGSLLTACAGNRAATGSLVRAPLSQRIGVQLYSVRDQMQQDFEGTIARVAEIGYNDVEFAGYFNRTPQQVRQILDRNHLTAPSSHIGLDQFRTDLQGTLEAAKIIGHEYVTVPSLGGGARTGDLEGWRSIAAEFNRYGAAAKEHGLKFAYHNHNFEYQGITGGQTGYDVLLRETDPELVSFEQDLYWTTYAGRDPIAIFNRAPRRFPLWHVKDLAISNGSKGMAPVGKGTIDWKSLFAQEQLSGLAYFFVEHDSAAQYPGGSLASIQTSYSYLKQLLA